uniref:Uncharacterized protein n=1 Tax=Solanum lycopersicum TaxID=4081 RepID=A0A3Q7GR12_SOLLC
MYILNVVLLPPVHIFLYYFLNVTVKSSILLYGLPDVLLYILLLRLQLNFIKTSEKPVKSSILLYGLPDVLLYILLLRLQLNFIKTSEKPGNQVVTYIYIFTSFPIYWLSHPHTLHLNLKYPIK